MQQRLKNATYFLLIAFLSFFLLAIFIPKAQPRLEQVATKTNLNKTRLQIVSLGDSLTEGIGDTTAQGGFVPILANGLQETFQLSSVETKNAGVAGERSDQILKRLRKKSDLQKSLADADILTLTVGGNDLIRVINRNIFGLTLETFEKPLVSYQKQLKELLEEMRKLNKTAPIYVLGIYNPFYLNFPEITDIQTIVNRWNAGSEAVTMDEEKVYFIPINDQIYQGIDGKQGIDGEKTTSETQDSSNLNEIRNNALTDVDKFHPNTVGYQVIAREFKNKIVTTKNDWLKGEKVNE